MAQTNTRRGVEPAKRNLLNLLPSEAEQVVRDFAVEHGEKPFRGSQVLRHIWQNPAASFAAMTDLPAAFRGLLDEHFTIPRLTLATRSRKGRDLRFAYHLKPDAHFSARSARRARWGLHATFRCSRSRVRCVR
jgi:adenine C2-methylase RlmN of 23S rRNA A2503 and tRNA A37